MSGQVIFPTHAEVDFDPAVAVPGRGLSAEEWETARAAQRCIVGAVDRALTDAPVDGDVPIVAHGGVGALLCHHLLDVEINRTQGQPHGSGGCRFTLDRNLNSTPTDWRAI